MRVLVTAGPTREAIDPVRFVSNRSSGKMGFAIARAAVAAGHGVTLVAGPVALRTPRGVARVDVVSAEEMADAVARLARGCDVLVMAAAPADWRPSVAASRKLKKRDGPPGIDWEPTPDILRLVCARKRPDQFFVGFAAETDHVYREAMRKLRDKGLDAIVANDVSRRDCGMGAEENAATVFTGGGKALDIPRMPKARVARRLVRWIGEAWAASRGGTA